jgi:hypothetical protein
MSALHTISEEISARLADLLATIHRSKAAVEASTAQALEMSEPYIGKTAAAEYLNISVTTLERRMALSDGPPRYVDGGKVSFLRSELRTWRRQWRAGDQTGLEES